MSDEKRLIVDWHGLKRMGWPFSRAHTWRMMQPEILRSSGSRRKGTYREWVEPNPVRFPRCKKLGSFRNSPPVWRMADVLAFFEAFDLAVTQDGQAL